MARLGGARRVTWSRAGHVLCGLVLAMCVVGCRAEEPTPASTPRTESERLDAQREMMVRTQIQARGVKDARVLAAMRKVPREEFVTADQRPFAFEDRPLPIGEEQTISQPYIVALMTELLELKEGEKVLEIGTGSGYQAAILAELTPNVYSIEILEPLAKRAKETLERLGYDGIKLMTGDGYKGWPEYAPFDAIIVTCAPESVPEPLKEQLREGGRMVIPVGPQWTGQTLYLLRKKGGELVGEEGILVRFVPMVRERDVKQ